MKTVYHLKTKAYSERKRKKKKKKPSLDFLVEGLLNEFDIFKVPLLYRQTICEKMYEVGINKTYKFPISKTNFRGSRYPASTEVKSYLLSGKAALHIHYPHIPKYRFLLSSFLHSSFFNLLSSETSSSLQLQHFYLPSYICILTQQSQQKEGNMDEEL